MRPNSQPMKTNALTPLPRAESRFSPRFHLWSSIRAMILALSLSDPAITMAQVVWEQVSPYPTHNALCATACGESLYVAGGDAQTILASIDGRNWTVCTGPGKALSYFAIAYGGGTFVAVGDFGIIASSSDGMTWVKRDSGTSAHLFGVTYGNGMFVAVGDNGTVLTSTDASSWSRKFGLSKSLACVTFGDGKFVAVGGRTSPAVAVSTNGLTWTEFSPMGNSQLRKVAYGNGRFVAAGGYEIQTSEDGVNWTLQTFATSQPLTALTFGAGKFVAGGVGGGIFVSTNGQQWLAKTNFPGTQPADAAHGTKGFVMVGPRGTMLLSADGEIWSNHFIGCPDDLSSVVFGAERFLAASVNRALMTSQDGITWTVQAAGGGIGNRVRFVKDRFYVVGEGLASSPDGAKWQMHNTGVDTPILSDVSYGNQQYLVCGFSAVYPPSGPPLLFPALSASTDGTSWQPINPAPDPPPTAMAFGNGRFVGIASKNEVAQLMSSTNGLDWTIVAWPGVTSLSDIVFACGIFVAVGQSGTILISTNGTSWTEATKETVSPPDLNGVTYADGQFVTVGATSFDSFGFAAVSADGMGWAPTTVPPVGALAGIAGGNGVRIAVGTRGVVLRSPVTRRPLRLGGWQHQGGFVVELEGTSGSYCTLQTSPDLRAWDVWTNVAVSGRLQWIKDPTPNPPPRLFYRGVE